MKLNFKRDMGFLHKSPVTLGFIVGEEFMWQFSLKI